MESDKSGLDELMRLSQKFTRIEQERTEAEKQQAERTKTIQSALQGLKEIRFSVALKQLKPVTTPEILEEVSSFKNKPETEDLRRLISELADDLENQISKISASNPDMVPIERSVKTLAILIDLFFSLQ